MVNHALYTCLSFLNIIVKYSLVHHSLREDALIEPRTWADVLANVLHGERSRSVMALLIEDRAEDFCEVRVHGRVVVRSRIVGRAQVRLLAEDALCLLV